MADSTTLGAGAADRTIDALLEIMRQASSPDMWEAQSMLLRRLALQGDVVGSRVPAPRNISEIGGYINLLTELQESEMRSQVLAGILGVAGANPPLGWLASRPPLAFVSLPNDRPAGPSQSAIPLAFAVRSDFVTAMQAALKALHDQGCALPLLASIPSLPEAAPGDLPAQDPLPYLGRALDVVPGTALHDGATDPMALARPSGTSEAYRIVARVMAAGPVAVTPANWDVMLCDATTCAPVAMPGSQFVPVAPALAAAGFYPASPLPQPTTVASAAWAKLTNTTGLVVGVTRLGDELRRLYREQDIAASAFGSARQWVWDGTAFKQP